MPATGRRGLEVAISVAVHALLLLGLPTFAWWKAEDVADGMRVRQGPGDGERSRKLVDGIPGMPRPQPKSQAEEGRALRLRFVDPNEKSREKAPDDLQRAATSTRAAVSSASGSPRVREQPEVADVKAASTAAQGRADVRMPERASMPEVKFTTAAAEGAREARLQEAAARTEASKAVAMAEGPRELPVRGVSAKGAGAAVEGEREARVRDVAAQPAVAPVQAASAGAEFARGAHGGDVATQPLVASVEPTSAGAQGARGAYGGDVAAQPPVAPVQTASAGAKGARQARVGEVAARSTEAAREARSRGALMAPAFREAISEAEAGRATPVRERAARPIPASIERTAVSAAAAQRSPRAQALPNPSAESDARVAKPVPLEAPRAEARAAEVAPWARPSDSVWQRLTAFEAFARTTPSRSAASYELVRFGEASELPVGDGLESLEDRVEAGGADSDPLRLVQERIAWVAHLVSPSATRRARTEGSARVDLRVGANGYVRAVRVVKSTGSPALDAEIESTVHFAEPFPQWNGWLTVTVEYLRAQ